MGYRLEVRGERILDIGNRRWDIGNRRWDIGDGILAIGDWILAMGYWIWERKMDEMWIKFAYIQKKYYFCNDLENYLATIYKTT